MSASDSAADHADPLHWGDQYLLGYGPIDELHEDFVTLVGAMQTAADAELPALLQQLATHLQEHFDAENQWMEETQFPPRGCHMDEHAAVMASVREVQSMLAQGEIGTDVVRDLVEHLADWFPKHADQLDSALAHWMFKQRMGGKPVVLRRGLSLR
ncbi:MAG: bacteriohemerythrin [Macromonas sp.]